MLRVFEAIEKQNLNRKSKDKLRFTEEFNITLKIYVVWLRSIQQNYIEETNNLKTTTHYTQGYS